MDWIVPSSKKVDAVVDVGDEIVVLLLDVSVHSWAVAPTGFPEALAALQCFFLR